MLNYKFAVQAGYEDRGVLAVMQQCVYRRAKTTKIEPFEIPLGSVEWTEQVLGRSVKPDYFPTFLSEHFHRKISYSDKWPLGTPCFIKPANKHKSWTARIYSGKGYHGKKPGPYVISEIVRFRNEYRYYVANGKLLSAWWYWGDSRDDQQRHEGAEPPDAPALDIQWPSTYCGAVDFGELWGTGTVALIEANAPFACGWYGVNPADYCEFLAAGWSFLNEKDRTY